MPELLDANQLTLDGIARVLSEAGIDATVGDGQVDVVAEGRRFRALSVGGQYVILSAEFDLEGPETTKRLFWINALNMQAPSVRYASFQDGLVMGLPIPIEGGIVREAFLDAVRLFARECDARLTSTSTPSAWIERVPPDGAVLDGVIPPTGLDVPTLQAALAEAGITGEVVPSGVLVVTVEDIEVFVVPTDKGLLKLGCPFTTRPDADYDEMLDFVNQVNLRFAQARTVVDDMHRIVVEFPVASDRGVVKATLAATVRFLARAAVGVRDILADRPDLT